MSDVRHHFPEEVLVDYAAGALSPSWSLAVDVHIEYCDACKNAIAALDRIGGAIVEHKDAAEISPETRAATFSAIASDAQIKPEEVAGRPTAKLPKAIRTILGGDLPDIKWRPIGGGIKQKILDTGDKAIARLLYIPAGVAAPPHSHRGNEATIVLAGGFYDGDASFTLGDVEYTDQTDPHQPQAMEDGPCVTLAVTDAPLKFVGLIPRLIQPFVKI